MDQNWTKKPIILRSHSNLSIPLIKFQPYENIQYQSFIYIKNNLSYLSSIKLIGFGGTGKLALTETRAIINKMDFSYFFIVF